MIKKDFNLKKAAGLAVICMTAMSFSAFGQKAEKSMTVKGELIDMSCYMASGAHGPDHKSCAKMCIGKGLPMGVLTNTGKVYLLVSNHDKPEAYAAAKKLAGDQVEITGMAAEKGGVEGLVVDNVKTGAK